MPAGALREKVTFQRLGADSGDGAGNYNTNFANLAGAIGIAADIAPVRQAEVVLAAGVQGRRLFELTVRYTPALAEVTVNDRVVDARDATRTFNIKGPPINQDKHKRYLKILVEQGGADG